MFSVDPATGDRTRVVIEAAFGLGEVVVGGEVEPDEYSVAKDPLRLLSMRIGDKRVAVRRGPDGVERRDLLDDDERSRRVLTDAQVLDLARLACRVEEHYGAPQDMEWALADGEFFLVQSRPITTLDAGPRAPRAGGSSRPSRSCAVAARRRVSSPVGSACSTASKTARRWRPGRCSSRR